jgi:hypothetical protein
VWTILEIFVSVIIVPYFASFLDVNILILQWPQKLANILSVVTEFPILHFWIKLWKSSEIGDVFLHSSLSPDYQISNMNTEPQMCCSLSHNRKYIFSYYPWQTATSNVRDLIWMCNTPHQ